MLGFSIYTVTVSESKKNVGGQFTSCSAHIPTQRPATVCFCVILLGGGGGEVFGQSPVTGKLHAQHFVIICQLPRLQLCAIPAHPCYL